MENKKTYKVIYSTEKAHLLQIDKVKFWVSKAFIKADQTLSEKAMEAYRKAKAKLEEAKKPSKIDVDNLMESEVEGHDACAHGSQIKYLWLDVLTTLLDENLEGVDVWGRVSKELQLQ